ncbi:TPA: hypothetical protein ACPJ09_004546 [Vibrio diabolicus]
MEVNQFLIFTVFCFVFWLVAFSIIVNMYLLNQKLTFSSKGNRLMISGMLIGGITAAFLVVVTGKKAQLVSDITDPSEIQMFRDVQEYLVISIDNFFQLFAQIVTLVGGGTTGGLFASGLVSKVDSMYENCNKSLCATNIQYTPQIYKPNSLDKFVRVGLSVKEAYRRSSKI